MDTCRPPSPRALGAMTNPEVSSGGMAAHWIARITAAGGGDVRSLWTNESRAPSDPNASISTPATSFRTRPPTPSSRASLYTQGRNPTPCTVPWISMRRPGMPSPPLNLLFRPLRRAGRYLQGEERGSPEGGRRGYPGGRGERARQKT